MARVELKDLLKIKMASGNKASLLIYDDPVIPEASSIVASILADGGFGVDLSSPGTLMNTVIAAIYQDDDAHDTCSLIACLNPLHPGPCKGWKHSLFKSAPQAWHALEAARVEKANKNRLAKIESLKQAGKPIPKKLLTPIVAKPHPHAGQTAKTAVGEAHEAGKGVTESAGVHVNTPGKVTLGQAVKQIKATDATAEKGPKGKKPTVASKGIAAVIAQEKVTPQYKLDKAATIDGEKWQALTDDEKSIIKGELTKIQNEGFGPQQKKATELLDKLQAVDDAKAKVDAQQAKVDAAEAKVKAIQEKHKATPPVVKEATEGPTPLAQATAVHAIATAIHGPQKTGPEQAVPVFEKMAAKTGKIEDHPAYKGVVNKLAQAALKKATEDKMPGLGHGDNDAHIGTFNKQIAEHIAQGKPGLPPLVAQMKEHHDAVKAGNVKQSVEKLAKEGMPPKPEEGHAEKAAKAKADLAEALKTPEGVAEAAKKAAPKASDAPKTALPKHVQHAIDMANGNAPGASWSKNHLAAYQSLTEDDFKQIPPETQAKILAELEKGKSKFLDPKKIKASQELIDKFKGASGGKHAAPAKIENGGEIGFQSHYNDHSVTPTQAKAAVKDVPPTGLFIATQKLVGLDDKSNPDSPLLAKEAMEKAKSQIASQTKMYGPEVLNDPDIKKAIQDAEGNLSLANYTFAVGKAKSHTYGEISKSLANDKDLSPIQRAALQKYQAYLLDHPVNTKSDHTQKLAGDAVTSGLALNEALQAKLKALNAPKPDEMSDYQIKAAAIGLLGADAVKEQFKPNFSEFNAAKKEGEAVADGLTKDLPEAVENDPQVAAKKVAVAQAAAELAGQKTVMAKSMDHVQDHHAKVLKDGVSVTGKPLTEDDKKIIAKHLTMIGKATNTAHTIPAAEEKLEQAKKDLAGAVEAAKGKHGTTVTLSDYDKATVTEGFSKAWSDAAGKAVRFGATGWSIKQKMKEHEDYPALTQDLGKLRVLAGEVALAHAEENAAKLSAPTHEETGAILTGTPEAAKWVAAMNKRADLEQEFAKIHKQAQAKLDAIRTSVGLKKRSLPKLDNSAVKTAAAEGAYYKTGGYGGPNYGKSAAAKSYMVAKVGPKLGVKHQSASEKKAEKLAATIAKEGTPGTVSKTGKYVPPPTSQPTKDKFPSAAEAGTSPSAESAAKYGFDFQAAPMKKVHNWPGDQGGAYVTTKPGHLAAAQRVLSNPDLKTGLEAQTQFKWSINNMDSKGAPSGSKGSLYNYTGSGYDAVNSKLNSLPPGTKKTGSTSISNIDKGMEASPEPENDLILYRGFKDPHGVFSSGKWNDVNVAGMEWSQKSYSSTSGNLSTAQSFAGYSGVVMRVIVPKAMKVKGINAKGGQHPGEAEIILQRGLRYRVVADYGKHGNQRYIDVMVVEDPYAQAE